MENIKKLKNTEKNIKEFTNNFKIIIKLGKQASNNNNKLLNNSFQDILVYPQFVNNNYNINELFDGK